MSTLYLAAKYDKRIEVLLIAGLLMLNGHTVKSEWLSGNHSSRSDSDKERYAKTDLAEIDGCDTFVMFQLPTDDPELSSGRQIEFGYALAKGKYCIVVGEGDSVFYTLAQRFFTTDKFLEAFAPEGKLDNETKENSL